MKKNRAMRLVSMVLAISTLLVPLRVFAATAGGMAANGKPSYPYRAEDEEPNLFTRIYRLDGDLCSMEV